VPNGAVSGESIITKRCDTTLIKILVIEYWDLRFICNLVLDFWDFIALMTS